jgi:hypothetical protein
MTSWIPVKITDGLFPSERTVQLPTTDGEISVFVSSSQLDEAKKELKVVLLDQDEQYALIQLPSQCDTTVAKVDRGLLRK